MRARGEGEGEGEGVPLGWEQLPSMPYGAPVLLTVVPPPSQPSPGQVAANISCIPGGFTLLTFQWVQSLFVGCLPSRSLLQLWDRVLAVGRGALMCTALAVLQRARGAICAAMEELREGELEEAFPCRPIAPPMPPSHITLWPSDRPPSG